MAERIGGRPRSRRRRPWCRSRRRSAAAANRSPAPSPGWRKPATASSTIDAGRDFGLLAETARGRLVGATMIGCGPLTGRSVAGFLPREHRRNQTTMIDKTYQPSEVEGRIYAAWEEAGAFRAGRPERRAAEALLHRHPAAQRHRLAAYGACAQQHAAGHAVPVRAHARHATCSGSPAPTMPASPPRWWSSAS